MLFRWREVGFGLVLNLARDDQCGSLGRVLRGVFWFSSFGDLSNARVQGEMAERKVFTVMLDFDNEELGITNEEVRITKHATRNKERSNPSSANSLIC